MALNSYLNKAKVVFPTPLLLNGQAPLDLRQIVSEKKDLKVSSFCDGDAPYWYLGMIVSCLEDGKVYILKEVDGAPTFCEISAELPDTAYSDTTYSFSNGSTLGSFTVTPSNGSAQTITVGGLGTAAGKNTEDFVLSEGYIPFTSALKTKLEGIADGAEINIIEEVQVNGVALNVSTDGKRAVNVVIPDATVKSVKANDKVLKLKGTELSTELSLVYESQGEGDAAKKYIVLRGINDVEIAKIDASDFIADSFLNDVTLDANDNLQFTWAMADGTTKTDTVNIAKYIDTYKAGNGIDITDKKVSVKVDATSEAFLTVGANGVKLSGVQEAIDTAVAAKNVSASGDTYVSATVAEGTNTVTVAASESTIASLALADSALQSGDITTGSANGAISVSGTDVAVKGLGNAAFAAMSDAPTKDGYEVLTTGGAYTLKTQLEAQITASEDARKENALVTAAALTELNTRVTNNTTNIDSIQAALCWQEGSFN